MTKNLKFIWHDLKHWYKCVSPYLDEHILFNIFYIYGQNSVLEDTVRRCFKKFRNFSSEDNARSGGLSPINSGL